MSTTTVAAPPPHTRGHRRGESGYHRLVVALFAAGLATFAQLYGVQALLPALARQFHASPSQAALTVSVGTGALALSVLPWSAAADRVGRVRVMTWSLVAATLMGLVAPFAASLGMLLLVRAVQGAALGGLPAVAMAYLAEEVDGSHVGRAAGIYIAGTSVGGLSGRILTGAVADLGGWRWGLGAVGVTGVAAAVVFGLTVPTARGFVPRGLRPSGDQPSMGLRRRLVVSLRDPALLALYAQGLLLMGGFVTVYNYLGFRLTARPWNLSQAVVGSLFVVYLAGTVSSAVVGRLAERVTASRLLVGSVLLLAVGAVMTTSGSLVLVLTGLVVLTAGFFGAHATASAWTGRRAKQARAQASALYTFAYYVGSSVGGWLGGLVYGGLGWAETVGFVVLLCALAVVAARPLIAERASV
jgi:MFS transporter, YNFM family, putative membrane transport protein